MNSRSSWALKKRRLATPVSPSLCDSSCSIWRCCAISRCVRTRALRTAGRKGLVTKSTAPRFSPSSSQWGSVSAVRKMMGICAVCRSALRRRQTRSEEHTSELQSQSNLVCRLLLEKKKKKTERANYGQERLAKNSNIDSASGNTHDTKTERGVPTSRTMSDTQND